MNKSKLKFLWALVVVAITGQAYQATALPNVGVARKPNGTTPTGLLKGTASLCEPATATIDLDINNVRARLMNGGDMWWDRATGTARYEVPKGSGKHSLYSGSVWVGGYDVEGNLKVAAQTYRQSGNDYWPGPLDVTFNSIDKATCSEWDKIWRINKSDLFDFRAELERMPGASTEQIRALGDNPKYQDIVKWPALGNELALGKSNQRLSVLVDAVGVPNHTYAPFVDINNDGVYRLEDGDYPDILGDQYTWWVFNDVGNTKTETGSGPIGMEIQTSAFAFSRKDYMNDATFINYRLINRGVLTMSETYMSTWTDADLGYGYDDYIGCDTARGLGILYNAKVPDGNGEVNSYGNQVPMVGVDFFIGPKHDTFENGQYRILDTLDMTIFNYFNNTPSSRVGNPNGALEIFRVMTGYNRVGDAMTDDRAQNSGSTGYTGSGPRVKFAYPGNPTNPAEWSQCQCGLPKTEDRRFVHSSGPFTLYAGGTTNDLTIGMVWVADVGGCPNATFARIRAADDLAQEFFDVNFRVIRGPDAPDMTIREGNRELIFYLTNNNPNSNNYQEKYGRDTAAKFVEYAGLLARRTPDSIYKFEGYRVFQLKNSTVTAAQIFGENGEINNQLAVEVFQSDIRNGVSTVINYEVRPEISASSYRAEKKVTGKDSGIVHSFRLTQDAFAEGNDSRFVNYHNYYFLAIAYAHNDFRTFSYELADSTQKRPYLESSLSWAPGARLALIPQAAMPNPTNGAMGTETPASYGDGVVIKRMEGEGNGGIFVQMDETSEEAALKGPDYTETQPVYKTAQGPVNIKVVDPRKVKGYEWELWLSGRDTGIRATGLAPGLSSWKLIRKDDRGINVDTIYSDRSLDAVNEQIITEYGFSVNVNQVVLPGYDQVNKNGYIGSSVTFAELSKPWLAGVVDDEFATPRNWIRSGHNRDTSSACNYKDNNLDTVGQFFENTLAENSLLKNTWAPYSMAVAEHRGTCGFGVALAAGQANNLIGLSNIDIVFTSDKSKWSRCAVIEMQDVPALAEGNAEKFDLRKHSGWNLGIDGQGRPTYSTNPEDSGTSWFPGYAINQITGKRVNIVFGEDSYLKTHGGADMIWNPTATISGFQPTEIINGGKHYIYVTDSLYDECKSFISALRLAKQVNLPFPKNNAIRTFQWVGLPTLAPGFSLLSLNDGLIPTETRLRFRVDVPFRQAILPGITPRNDGYPIYFFTTRDIAVRPLEASNNTSDRQKLLDGIRVVPNPYYGYSGYENNRLDNRVRITNLPNRATISIYSIDGTLIRRLEHVNSEETTRGFEDWDIRNAKGLQIASGMYLLHVKAEGLGETVIKWFGAMKPADITDY
jgi:hypothetical protein